MRGLLSSPRRRKRAAILGVLAAGAIVAAVLGSHFSNTAHPQKETFEGGKAQVTRTQKPVKLSAQDQRAVLSAVDRFVNAAVARRDLPAAYDLTTANIHGGVTRAQWAKGDTPIYPYPVAQHSAVVRVAYPGDAVVQLLLKARPASKVDPLAVQMELRAAGKGAKRRWLVDYYLPQETLSAPSDAKKASGPEPKAPGIGPHLTQTWLLVPLAFLGLIVLVPVGIGLRDWRQGRAAEKAYGGGRSLPPLPTRRDDP